MSIYIADPRKRGPHCPGVETVIMWQQPGTLDVASYAGFTGEPWPLYDNTGSIAMQYPGSGFSQLTITFPEPKRVNAIAFAGCNWEALDNFFIDGYVPAEDDIRVISQSTNFEGLSNNQPLVVKIDDRYEYSQLLFHITRNSTFRVGEIAAGFGLVMPTSPSTGFQPSLWNWRDRITHHITEGQLVGNSTITPMGSEQMMRFPFLPREFMDLRWGPFVEQAYGKPIWCGWHMNGKPQECIYGTWSQRPPKYGILSEVNMTMRGASQ